MYFKSSEPALYTRIAIYPHTIVVLAHSNISFAIRQPHHIYKVDVVNLLP
jgi:hypothetical protein